VKIRIHYEIDVTEFTQKCKLGVYAILRRAIRPFKIACVVFMFIFLVGVGHWVWLERSQPRQKYAVLISAGETFKDETLTHSEYWNDLLMIYKSLIDQGYTHENIYVFYGEGKGTDFESKYDYYNASTYFGIPSIIDYSNHREDIYRGFEELNYKVTKRDKLIIRWVIGHGGVSYMVSNGYDKYEVYLERWDSTRTNMALATVPKDTIIQLINSIKDYKQREIYWLTCFSGSMVMGIQPSDFRTTIITSGEWDEYSMSSCPEGSYYPLYGCNGYVSGDFNWEMYGIYHKYYFNETPYVPYNEHLKYPITPYKIYRELLNSETMHSTVQIGGKSPTVLYIKFIKRLKAGLKWLRTELKIIWET